MADLRLLAAAIGPMILLSVAGCAPLQAPHLAGRLVDAESKQPVSDAEILSSFDMQQRFPWVSATTNIGDRWTTTDAEGHFAFKRETIERWFPWYRWRVRSEPFLLLVNRHYGKIYIDLPPDRSKWSELLVEVSPDRKSLWLFENRRRWSELCSGWDKLACRRMCLLAYEDPKYCEEAIR